MDIRESLEAGPSHPAGVLSSLPYLLQAAAAIEAGEEIPANLLPYLGGAPYVGNEVFGLSSSEIGILFAITAIGYAAGNFFAGRYSVRLGMNRMVLIGSIVNVAGMGLLCLVTWAGVHSAYVFFGFTVAVGLGNGLTLPNANAGMLSIKPELAGTASGLGGAIQIGGGAALAALAGTLLGPGATEMPLILQENFTIKLLESLPQAVSHCAAEILPAVSSMFRRNTLRDKPCFSIFFS